MVWAIAGVVVALITFTGLIASMRSSQVDENERQQGRESEKWEEK